MVPLLIHLPPISDDIDGGQRDAREIAEENISKAQVLYNVIASTATKGFKSKFYGQRHMAFEIIASKGIVNFYAIAPVAMVGTIEQAITSAYPNASLEEVEEHNLFNEKGKITGTYGGELVLKRGFSYPIASYQDVKRDAMQAILNSLATLGKEDGAGIQILFRPANPGWVKTSKNAVVKFKQNRYKHGIGGNHTLKDVGSALWKPPEGELKQEEKQLSSLEQAELDAIEEKTRYPGYETLIRVVSSSNTAARSQVILQNVVSAFSLFDSPGRNGFKFVPAKVIESFVTAFIFRFFPPEINKNILNSVEMATLFHFPDQKNTPTAQLQRQTTKQVDGPNGTPEQGLLLGFNVFRGVKKAIRLSEDDRRRHMYIIGQTGTGKSWLLKGLIMQDILAGRGLAFIDPHGDAAEDILGMIPKERAEDVVYFAPGEMDYPVGLNLFEYEFKEQQDFLIQEAINMLYQLYDPNRQGMIGARFEHIFRNAALLLMADPQGGSIVDIPKLLVDPTFMKSKLRYATDQPLIDFWTREWPASQRSNEAGEVTSWVVSKFSAFLNNQMMRNIIGQTKSGLDLRKIMDEGKILLVNLSKGRTGDLNAKLLGMIFVMKFYAAAMGRAHITESERRDFTLYVDEFQNFSTETFSDILSEARKYRLSLTVANQFVGQLTDEIRDAVFGNVGTVISSRTGANDAEFLVKYFSPIFDAEDMTKMPNQNWVVQTLVRGVPTQPFSMESARLEMKPNPKLITALKNLSYAKYGRPRGVVEKEIFDRLKTQEPPRPSFGDGSGGRLGAGNNGLPSGVGQRSAMSQAGSPGGSSFLDEWLAKRKAGITQPQTQTPRASQTQSAGFGNPAKSNQISAPTRPANQSMSTTLSQPAPSARPPMTKPEFQSLDKADERPLDKPELRPLSEARQPSTAREDSSIVKREDSQGTVLHNLQDVAGNKTAEDIVVNINQKQHSSKDEQSKAVNEAIQEGQLTAGEIAIDRQGVIHHSDDEEL